MSNSAVHNPDKLASSGDPPWRFFTTEEIAEWTQFLKDDKSGQDYTYSRAYIPEAFVDGKWIGHFTSCNPLSSPHLTFRTRRPLPAAQPPASPPAPEPEPGETPLTEKLKFRFTQPVPATGWIVRAEEFAKLERRAIEAETRCAELERALTTLMKLRSTIEVMGEWSALDVNPKSYKREAEKVDAAMRDAQEALKPKDPQ